MVGKCSSVTTKVINPMGAIGADGKERFYQIHGEYVDEFVKTPQGWRIQNRTWHHGWISGDNPYDGRASGEVRAEIAGLAQVGV